MSEIVAKLRERMNGRVGFLRREEAIAGENIEDLELVGEGSPRFEYEPNWTSLLADTDISDEVRKRDVMATKLAAKVLCHAFAPAYCRCGDDALKCHALKDYMKPALQLVQALRKSNLLR